MHDRLFTETIEPLAVTVWPDPQTLFATAHRKPRELLVSIASTCQVGQPFAFVKQKELARKLGVGRRSILSRLQRLEVAGLVVVYEFYRDGKQQANIYWLPELAVAIGYTEPPDVLKLRGMSLYRRHLTKNNRRLAFTGLSAVTVLDLPDYDFSRHFATSFVVDEQGRGDRFSETTQGRGDRFSEESMATVNSAVDVLDLDVDFYPTRPKNDHTMNLGITGINQDRFPDNSKDAFLTESCAPRPGGRSDAEIISGVGKVTAYADGGANKPANGKSSGANLALYTDKTTQGQKPLFGQKAMAELRTATPKPTRHAYVKAFRGCAFRYPSPRAQEYIIEMSEHMTLDNWRRAVNLWVLSGFNPTNIPGMVQWAMNPQIMDDFESGKQREEKAKQRYEAAKAQRRAQDTKTQVADVCKPTKTTEQRAQDAARQEQAQQLAEQQRLQDLQRTQKQAAYDASPLRALDKKLANLASKRQRRALIRDGVIKVLPSDLPPSGVLPSTDADLDFEVQLIQDERAILLADNPELRNLL